MERGDSFELLSRLEDMTIDHVICDPPYSEHVHTKGRAGTRGLKMGNGKITFNREVEFGFEHLRPWQINLLAAHYARLTRQWVIIFCDERLDPIWRAKLTKFGLEIVRQTVWIKEGCSPQFTGDRPATGHEIVLLAHHPGRKKWNGGGRRGVWIHPVVQARGAAVSERVHTTQKPLSLMLELVELFTDHGDLVLDPFAGSGTTGAACVRLGRRFLGFELKEEYYKTSCERMRAESEGSNLQAARAGQIALFGGK